MRLDERLHEAQPETEAALGATGVATKQPIPDPRLLVDRDPRTRVPDPQHRAIALPLHLHIDPAPGRRVLHRVVHEIRDDAFEPDAIAVDNDVGCGPRVGGERGSTA